MSINITEKLRFHRYHLLVFDEYIVALEIKIREESLNQKDFFGRTIKIKVPEKTFSMCFKMNEFDTFSIQSIPNSGHLLWVKSFTNMSLDPSKSFVIKFDNIDEAAAAQNDLKLHREKSRENINTGTNHKGHKYAKFTADGSQDHKRCGSKACQDLFLGVLYSAVKCETCDNIYHSECFSSIKADNDPEEDEEYNDPADLLIEKQDSLELQDFDL